MKKRVRLFAYVSALTYLARGGRISAVAGLIGGTLKICPIISVHEGAACGDYESGPIIGTHTGPVAAGVAFAAKG